MKVKLAFAAALSHKAELLILDEATGGLDPIMRDDILNILMDFVQDENHSVLLGMLCLLICIVIDFGMKNNRSLAAAIQLALIVPGAGGIYAVGKAQVNIIELLLSVSSAAILGILAASLLGTVIATYFVCIPAVQKR